MKVLITRNADTSNYGGAETYVVELVRQLEANNINTVVGTAMPRLAAELHKVDHDIVPSPWLNWQRWHGIYTPLVILLHGPWILRLVWWYLRRIRIDEPDLLHPMNRDDWIAATIAGWITKTPVVWTDHADLKHEVINTAGMRNLIGKIVLYWAQRASAIMVVSNAEKQAIEASVGDTLKDKLCVVYNGITSASYEPKPKTKNTVVIGITARMRNQKGLRELIDAFKKLTPPPRKKLELWLIGDGPDEATLQKRADGDPRIRFLGFKKDWMHWVAALDIFAFPSYSEGFSLSLLEAAMLARPIVATNVGGNPEVIVDEKTGLLVRPKEIDALASALQRLIDDPQLAKKLGSGAHGAWEKNFQFDRIVETDIIAIYQHAIGRAR